MKKRHVALVLGSLLLTGAALAQPDAELPAVVYQTANVRGGPDTRFEIVEQLAQDTAVTVIGREGAQNRWLYIRMESGERGWLPSFVLLVEGDLSALPIVNAQGEGALPSEAVSGTAVRVIAYGRVNVRGQPSISGEIVGQLDVDQEASALARSNHGNDWLLIVGDDGLEGWVAYFTVRVSGDIAALPVLVPDTYQGDLIAPSMLIRTEFNVRLHRDPDLNSPTTAVVPFDRQVTPIARSADSVWLYVGYNGRAGWGVTELFDIGEAALVRVPIYRMPRTPAPITAPTPLAPIAITPP